MNRKQILVLFLAVAVFAALAAWGTGLLFLRFRERPVDSDMATYRNEEYGFELAYPKGLVPETSFRRYYALSDKWRSQAPEGQAGAALVAIPVFRIDNKDGVATGKPYPLYFSAETRVGASSDSQAVADCLKTDPGYAEQEHETVALNGIQFEKFYFQDAAMMQYAQGVSYRAVHNNTCFAVEALRAGSSYRDESMTPGVPQAELDARFAEAEAVAKTFKFTK